MKISDEVLMAYADDELTPEQRAEVERAIEQDAGLGTQVERHRQLRQRLRGTLAPALQEAVPDRLLQTLQAPPSERVTDLASRRTKAKPVSWGLGEWSAMAACLVAGVGLGIYFLNAGDDAVTLRNGVMVVSRSLSGALDTQLAAQQGAADAVQIGISFRERGGDYCRTFTVPRASLAGMACKRDARWQVELLTAGERDGAQYRQAGSTTPAAVLAMIEQRIDGEPLDAGAEAAAREQRWRSH